MECRGRQFTMGGSFSFCLQIRTVVTWFMPFGFSLLRSILQITVQLTQIHEKKIGDHMRWGPISTECSMEQISAVDLA